MRDPGLEPDELAALHLAGSAVRMEGVGGAEALRKLGGAAGPAPGEHLASVPTDPRLTTLYRAVTGRTTVSFRYRAETRTVEPWRLDFVRGRWYITGFDQDRGGERNFRLDRIDGDITIGDPASTDRGDTGAGIRRQPWELGDEPPQTARLLVDADQAAWAQHHIGEPTETRDDGSIVLEVAVTNEDAFRAFVLTFLEHAEILEPSHLRDAMRDWLQTIAGTAP